MSVFIGPFETGLEKDKDPYLLPNEAFSELEDAFVFRGRVERRRGFVSNGRLRRVIASTLITQTTAAGVTTTITDLLADASINLRATEANAELQPGSVAVVSGANTWDDTTTPGVMTATGGNAADGTINYVTGEIVLNFSIADAGGNAINVAFNYFPSFPVMGLPTRELPLINKEQTIAFDTKYAYRFTATGWEELPSNTPTTWNGDNSQFFWTTNYRGSVSSEQFFWVTNFNDSVGGGDPIYYYDPNAAPADWTVFAPTINGANELHQCKIILPFKDRLLTLNTWEGATLAASVNYPQRLRYSQNGDPSDTTNGWRDDIVGRGGFIDAPTSEAIVSAQYIKDHVIVFFERSTWELVYNGNELLPFIWKKLNTELGAESTFSEVPFDDGVLSIGDTGIHVANASGVQRIDVKIPDIIGQIKNLNEGTKRVYGIRDYNDEVVYWTLPTAGADQTFPNKVLVYNYRNQTFAIFNDSFTCYGYFQRQTGYTWATLPYGSWAAWNVPWNSGALQGFFRQIIVGNQQGYTALFDGSSSNDVSLSVTDITASTVTSLNHNLSIGQYVTFSDLTGVTITPIAPNTTQTFMVLTIPTVNTFTIDGAAAGAYPGGGSITVLNNINIRTKEFDFTTSEDARNLLEEVQFLFDRTSDGEVTLEVYQESADSLPMPVLFGTKAVRTRPESNEAFQSNQKKIWHRTRRNIIADSVQMQITLSDEQMRDPGIQMSSIVMHAILMTVTPTGRKK